MKITVIRKFALLYTVLIIPWHCYTSLAQTTFAEGYIIQQASNNIYFNAEVGDLDNDGDIDVVATLDDNTVWYKNDGKGNFGNPITICLNMTNEIQAIDMDNDNDLDIIYNNFFSITWRENDGKGDFSKYHILASGAGNMNIITAVNPIDIDQDNDIDIIAAMSPDHAYLYCYINNGQGDFKVQTPVKEGNRITFACAIDVDNDGDLDIIGALGGAIVWYENKEQKEFMPKKYITKFIGGMEEVYSVDFDKDMDMDILSVSTYDGISWYENNGKDGFNKQHWIDVPQLSYSKSYFVGNACAADLDNDGDIDVLGGSYMRNIMAWYENDGIGNFGLPQNVANTIYGASDICVADFDKDNDLDVLAVLYNDKTLIWYENLLYSTINSVVSNSVPYCFLVENTLTIQQRTASVAYYTLYNTIGQAVAQGTFNTARHTISVAHLPTGMYSLQINGQCLKVVK
ncbi:MAG: VCBS repeat-containing protein [Chitinophagales bacterium]|nr:VCBS repeat-containing protein [Chitinophagales bacterium]